MGFDDEKRNEIRNLLSQNESQLFDLLGEQVLASVSQGEGIFNLPGANIPSPRGAGGFGATEGWGTRGEPMASLRIGSIGRLGFRQMRDSLYETVCVNWDYCNQLKENAFNDDVSLVLAVEGVICGIVGAIPVSTVATILVKRGLNSFCACE